MDFSKWLKGKFLSWQMELDESRTQAQFAAYLGVPPTSLSNWMNTGSKPRSEYIGVLASKLGPEIYDILGMPRESGDEEDKQISEHTRHLTTQKKREVLEFIRKLEYLDAPSVDGPTLTSKNLAGAKK